MAGKYRIAYVFGAGVFLLQLLSLNIPAMNGDEAIYCLIRDQIVGVLSGHWPKLNPIIDYSGPLDFWLMGSLYGALGVAGNVWAAAWMVRIIPLLVAWAGILYLFSVLRRSRKELAAWWIFAAASAPMFLVYSRSAFPHAFFLGIFSALLAESILILTTGEVRWLRIALLSGFALEANTTAFFGIAVTFLPAVRPLLAWAGKNIRRTIYGLLVFAVLAYPVLRNFPPPTASADERGPNIPFEIRNFFSMVDGTQPIVWLMHQDPAPIALCLVFLAFLSFCLVQQFRAVVVKKEDLLLRRFWWPASGFSLLTAVFCYRGRSLTLIGHERYFLYVVPIWTLLWADAFRRVRYAQGAAVLVGGLMVFRLFGPVVEYSEGTDPSLLSARWLRDHCPKETCVAAAFNFWNYWPIRYYTRGALDLYVLRPTSWVSIPVPPLAGRKQAGCWYTGSPVRGDLYSGRYSSTAEFPEQFASRGQICFDQVELRGP